MFGNFLGKSRVDRRALTVILKKQSEQADTIHPDDSQFLQTA
jgi:hypothetical protein